MIRRVGFVFLGYNIYIYIYIFHRPNDSANKNIRRRFIIIIIIITNTYVTSFNFIYFSLVTMNDVRLSFTSEWRFIITIDFSFHLIWYCVIIVYVYLYICMYLTIALQSFYRHLLWICVYVGQFVKFFIIWLIY